LYALLPTIYRKKLKVTFVVAHFLQGINGLNEDGDIARMKVWRKYDIRELFVRPSKSGLAYMYTPVQSQTVASAACRTDSAICERDKSAQKSQVCRTILVFTMQQQTE